LDIKVDGFLKFVTPVKTGVQGIYNSLKMLDSGFRRNDGKPQFQAFYEIIEVRDPTIFNLSFGSAHKLCRGDHAKRVTDRPYKIAITPGRA
jgi:hypothetical protein